MDKITEQTNNMLFEVFGLCPEYKVVWTEHEWREYYVSPSYDGRWVFGGIPDWRSVDPYSLPEKVRLHLTEHKTLLANGLCVSAYFAVCHPARTIYLRIMKVTGGDAYCQVSNK
jgi:hypothetical protein